ncbi:MAG: prepilin-type N-terminal cleavage/methylation domain-containing protein, partial [Bdellovibrionaceae bacterium]|nr:prepilin-type N-terminal cleavage/methylation domain-containing protein [Pseudobdellovibrionaceae bacterium]MDW8189859.1 prepilin-type N-terminal cleavage/methylation domain-containing protein [Pseudobdellovibrionaceae bacterium]
MPSSSVSMGKHYDSKLLKSANISHKLHGITLVEMLIAVFILGFIGLAVNATVVYMNTSMRNTEIGSNYLSHQIEIADLVRNRVSMTNSAEDSRNTNLRHCILGSDNRCQHMEETEIQLYSSIRDTFVRDQSGNQIAVPSILGGGREIVCDPSRINPQFYTTEGRRCECNASPTLCPIQVVSTFRPFCRGGTTTCSRAHSAQVRLIFQMRPDFPEHLKKQQPFNNIQTTEKTILVDFDAEDEFYIQFQRAETYNLIGVPPQEIFFQSLSFTQIREGVPLAYQLSGRNKFVVHFNSPQPLQRVSLLRYVYPEGCNLLKLGSTGCRYPRSSDFEQVEYIDVSSLSRGIVTFTNSIQGFNRRVFDYRLSATNTQNQTILFSSYDLRVFAADPGSVEVRPPFNSGQELVLMTCNQPNPQNNFGFRASSEYGWRTVEATYWDLNNPSVISMFPDFHTSFNRSISTWQSLSINSMSAFQPNRRYNIKIRGITNQGLIVEDIKSFNTGSAPFPSIIGLHSPGTNTNIRSVDPLNVTFDFQLPCGQSPSRVEIRTRIQYPYIRDLMPFTNILSSCSNTNSDLNIFRCNHTFSCDQWTNADSERKQCYEMFSGITWVNVEMRIFYSSNPNPIQNGVTISVTNKITFEITPQFRHFTSLMAPAPILNTGGTLPIQIELKNGARLNSNDDVQFQVTGTSINNSTIYRCRVSGSVNVSYYEHWGRYFCQLNVPYTGLLNAQTLTVTTTNPTLYEMNPLTNTVEIESFGAESFSC